MKKASTPVDLLNSLITINTRRCERYKRAANHMKDLNGKLLFLNYAVQSQEFINKLNKWLSIYEPTVVSHTGSFQPNVFVKSWTGLRSVFFLGGKKVLLGYCEFIELESLKKYKTALSEPVFLQSTMVDIQKQINEVEEAYLTIKSMKESNSIGMQVANFG